MTIIGAKNKVFPRHVLPFLRRSQKLSVFREIVQIYVDCPDVHATKIAGTF
jgi:hypothetical protein